MPLSPLADRVLVIPQKDPSETPSGLVIPDKAKQRPDQGVIITRGPKTIDVRVGDVVYFSGWDGTLLTVEGEGTFVCLREDQIVAIEQGVGDRLISWTTLEEALRRTEAPRSLCRKLYRELNTLSIAEWRPNVLLGGEEVDMPQPKAPKMISGDRKK